MKVRFFLSKYYDYIVALLIVTLPFSKALPNPLLGILALSFLLDVKQVNFRAYKKSPFLLLSVLLLFLMLKAAINGTYLQDAKYYGIFPLLIFVPVLFLKVQNMSVIKIACVVAVNASVLLSLYKIAVYYSHFHYLPFTQGWAVNYVLTLERPYQGAFCVAGVVVSLDLMKNMSRYKVLYGASALTSVFFIFLISARLSIVALAAIGVCYVMFYLRTKLWYRISFLGLGVVLLAVVMISNDTIAKRFFIKDDISTTLSGAKSEEPRVVIWNCAKDMTSSPDYSIFTGMPSYSLVKQKYKECYAGAIDSYNRKEWFVSRGYNSHNQLIDFALIGGAVGVLLFLGFIGYALFYIRRDFFALAIFLSFVFFLFVENVFYRQFGTYIFIIFTATYLTNLNRIDDKN